VRALPPPPLFSFSLLSPSVSSPPDRQFVFLVADERQLDLYVL